MLAVTEVNGCEACSYAHTLMALRKGFSNEEIAGFLSASDACVVPEEAQGILFAQHYADSRGRPSRAAYEALLQEYGPEKSRAVVAAHALFRRIGRKGDIRFAD
jgi:AhpD family alkylhydroperoxidase